LFLPQDNLALLAEGLDGLAERVLQFANDAVDIVRTVLGFFRQLANLFGNNRESFAGFTGPCRRWYGSFLTGT
jgi:hypothetical protein